MPGRWWTMLVGVADVTLWDIVRVPFDVIRNGYWQLRKVLFTASRPSGEYFTIDELVETIERHLGNQSFAPNWEFSYYERGEVLNLAQVVYEHAEAGGEPREWWQTHVRGWRNDQGRIELHGHWELEPIENGHAHIDGVGFSFERGMANLRSALETSNLEYEVTTVKVDSPDDDG